MAGTLPYGTDSLYEQLLSEDQEAAGAAREIKACLTASEPSKALMTCDRMLSLHPDNRLFVGLKLEAEDKEREVRLDFIRRLCSELDNLPDLDARIDAIQQALHRYPDEPQLLQLLKNATARRDLYNAVIAEARNEETSDEYAGALRRWYLIRELHPRMPGLENEIRRLESLADSQRRMKRRAEFVDAIFRLSSTGEYTRALYQCINALAEYPEDGGLLALKKNVEEKAQHATELQKFISEGLTFLQSKDVDAALECFGKARAFDHSNLQVRYLIGIALLEKARLLMYNDRQKLHVLLDEAKSFMPNQPELQAVSFELEGQPDESWEKSLVRVGHPSEDLQQNAVQPPTTVQPVAAPPQPPPVANSTLYANPGRTRNHTPYRNMALFALVLLGAFTIGWFVYAQQPNSEGSLAIPPANIDIQATPEGAEIFIDSEKLGESRVQTQLPSGTHTVSVSLAGYETQTLPVELGSEPTALQIDLRPALLDVHIVSDQAGGGTVWIDDQIKGDITESGITISGVEPGIRVVKMVTPNGELELSFEFAAGKIPTPKSLPPRQIANVLFAGSADGKSRVECNCLPAGLRVGDLAERIPAGGLEVPLAEGEHRAELWLGKRRKEMTLHGSRLPVATIAVFSNMEAVTAIESSIQSSTGDQGSREP